MNKNTTIEQIDTNNISEQDLFQIHEIEQDTWAFTIWEYVKCNSCWKINSKKDVYWNLSKDIFTKTVKEIEKIVWLSELKCIDCWSHDCEHIFWEKYIEEIVNRYKNKIHSFLVVNRNKKGDIVLIQDWYISSFDDIFEKELFYYKKIWKYLIKKLIEEKIWKKTDWNIFIPSSIWTKKEVANIENVIEQTKFFLNLVATKKDDFDFAIFELKIWSVIQKLFSKCWCIPLWLIDNEKIYNKISQINHDSKSDIFVHPDISIMPKIL